MKEKILALLLAKFAGVRKDVLAHLAGSINLQAATEEEANAIVEKLTAEKVNEFVKDVRKDVDKEVSDSNRTYEANLRKKYKLTEIEKQDPDPDKTDPQPGDPAGVAAIVKAAVSEAVKPLQEKLAGLEGRSINETRLQALGEKLKGVPETFKTQKLKDFSRMTFTDDLAFTEFLTETEAGVAAFNQELAEKGLSGQSKPIFGNKNSDGISKGTADYIAAKTAESKPLAGKEV